MCQFVVKNLYCIRISFQMSHFLLKYNNNNISIATQYFSRSLPFVRPNPNVEPIDRPEDREDPVKI